MRRKYPAFLPGKELGAAHFEPLIACELSQEEIEEALAPLWALAAKRRWANLVELSEVKEQVKTKRSKQPWQLAETWGGRINWNHPEESQAAAGWIILRNLERGRQAWRSYRRPYGGLLAGRAEDFLRALRLACIFEKGLDENEQEGKRHILGLIIVLLGNRDLDALGREAIGGSSIGAKGSAKLLAISHGLNSPNQSGWIRADLSTIQTLTAKLEKSLSETQREGIRLWNKKLTT